MWTTTDTTAALVTARNEGRSLTSVKSGDDDSASNKTTSQGASLLESLAAVVPTGVTGLYTTAAVVLHQQAEAAAESERSALVASLTELKKTPAEIAAALNSRAQESEAYVGLRITLLVIAALVAFTLVARAAYAANGAAKKKRRVVVVEPIAALVAFLGWSLAAPGTPIGAYLSANSMQNWSVAIGGIAGLLLAALGHELTKPAARAR